MAEGRKQDVGTALNLPTDTLPDFDFSEPLSLPRFVPICKRTDTWLSENPGVVLALEIIAQIFGITINDIWGKSRREYINVARQAAALVFRAYGLKWREMAITMERREPTLFNTCVVAQRRQSNDSEFASRINLCMNSVRSHLNGFLARKR